MIEGLLISIGMLFSIIGCGYFALSQTKHWRVVNTTDALLPKQGHMKLLGTLALITSLVLYILEGGAGFAVLLWPLSLGFGIFFVAMLLTYKPTILRILIL
jgi:hypothetical protein